MNARLYALALALAAPTDSLSDSDCVFPLLSGVSVDSPDMTNIPPGDGPYISAAPARIPVGVQTIRVKGGRFGSNPTALLVQIQPQSGPPIPVQPTIVDGQNLTLKLSWPANQTGQSATILVSKSDGSSPSTYPGITLVRLAFRMGSTAMGSAVSVPTLKKPQWIYAGQIAGMNHLFVGDAPNVFDIPYSPSLGTPLTLLGMATGAAAIATADLDNDGSTDCAAVNSVIPVDLNAYLAANSYSGSGAGTFGTGMNSINTIAAGFYDTNRSLIATAGSGGQFFACRAAFKPFFPTPCVSVATLPSAAKALWVNTFVAPRADILMQNVKGELGLWRSGGSDVFADQSAMIAAVAGKSFTSVAVGDVDGKGGDDIVAIDGSSITTLQNDGQGRFSAAATAVTAMPQAQGLLLGDIDGDGAPELVLTEATTGAVWVFLNQVSGGAGDSWIGPAPAYVQASDQAIAVPANGLVGLDGLPKAKSKNLLMADVASQQIIVWANAKQP